MIVAAHQPNVFPWSGYFAKIAACDRFVVLDHVAFASTSRRNYTNHVQLRGAAGAWWLAVPVLTAGRVGQPIRDVAIAPDPRWRGKLLRRVEQEYRRAPRFAAAFPVFERCVRRQTGSLAAFNLGALREAMALLGLERDLVLSSSLGVEAQGAAGILAAVKAAGGTTYLSGLGARAYQDEADFRAAGVELVYQDHRARPYPQVHGAEFVAGLSLWDALFNLGPEAARALI